MYHYFWLSEELIFQTWEPFLFEPLYFLVGSRVLFSASSHVFFPKDHLRVTPEDRYLSCQYSHSAELISGCVHFKCLPRECLAEYKSAMIQFQPEPLDAKY